MYIFFLICGQITIVPKPELFSGFCEDSRRNKSTIWGDLGGSVPIICSDILVDGRKPANHLESGYNLGTAPNL